MTATLTQQRAMQVVAYDAETGELRWLVASSPKARHHVYRPGDVVSGRQSQGYIALWVDGRKYLAHRVAFLIAHGRWPAGDVDHVNGNKTDNRIENLREATRVQNNGNTKLPRHNTSGMKGVRRHRAKWVAQISIENQCRYLGIFETKEQAGEAYAKAAQEHFGEFARPTCP